MAVATSTPPRRAARTATKAAPAKAAEDTAVEASEAVDVSDDALERIVHTLENRGRTKNGEGKEIHWYLYANGARGQIFTEPDVVEVKILIVRNTQAVV